MLATDYSALLKSKGEMAKSGLEVIEQLRGAETKIAALQQRLTIADQQVDDLTTLAKQAYMEGWELGWVERHTDANNEKRVSPWAPPRNVMEREWLTSEAYTELKGISKK